MPVAPIIIDGVECYKSVNYAPLSEAQVKIPGRRMESGTVCSRLGAEAAARAFLLDMPALILPGCSGLSARRHTTQNDDSPHQGLTPAIPCHDSSASVSTDDVLNHYACICHCCSGIIPDEFRGDMGLWGLRAKGGLTTTGGEQA